MMPAVLADRRGDVAGRDPRHRGRSDNSSSARLAPRPDLEPSSDKPQPGTAHAKPQPEARG
jgi:hypothetical protein